MRSACSAPPGEVFFALGFVPDIVHVLVKGKIVKTGGKELALELEEKGYAEVSG